MSNITKFPNNEPLDEAHTRSCQEINQLFDAVAHEKGLREWAIFQQVYSDKQEAYQKMTYFLKHVGECPPEVVSYCRKLLAGRR